MRFHSDGVPVVAYIDGGKSNRPVVKKYSF